MEQIRYGEVMRGETKVPVIKLPYSTIEVEMRESIPDHLMLPSGREVFFQSPHSWYETYTGEELKTFLQQKDVRDAQELHAESLRGEIQQLVADIRLLQEQNQRPYSEDESRVWFDKLGSSIRQRLFSQNRDDLTAGGRRGEELERWVESTKALVAEAKEAMIVGAEEEKKLLE
jgi:hypothetical protein